MTHFCGPRLPGPLDWSEIEVEAFYAQWPTDPDPAIDPSKIPFTMWPRCIVEDCPNRCSLKLRSKMCHPHTLRARSTGERA